MYLWRYTQHQVTRIEFIGNFSPFSTGCKIEINCLLKGVTDFLNTLSVKGHDISNTGDTTDEALILVTVFNTGRIIFISHWLHGSILSFSKNLQAAIHYLR